MTSARVQRWALMLAAYDYSVVYRPGSKLVNADSLTRLPMPQSVPTPPVPGDTIMLLEKMDEFPVNVSQIRTWTNKDPLAVVACEKTCTVRFSRASGIGQGSETVPAAEI